MKRALLIGIAIAAGILLTTCENALLLLEKLDDQVMVANDRYLEVVETYPEQNDQNLSPRLDLLVTLDRPVDENQIRDYITILQRDISGTEVEFGTVGDEEVEVEFNDNDLTLTITPIPFLNGGEKVTVKLKPPMQALDGAKLRDEKSWSFYTSKMPVGVFEIDGVVPVNAHRAEGYADSRTLSLLLSYGDSDEFALTVDSGEADNPTTIASWPGTSAKSLENDPSTYTLPDADGLYTLYVFFRDLVGTYSLPYSQDIFLDRLNPTLTTAGSSLSARNTTVTRSVTFSDAAPSSKFQKAEWWSVPAGVDIPDDSALTTDLTGPGSTDQLYTIYVRTYDNAGNASTTRSFTMDWDTLPPGLPNLSNPATPSASRGSWTWAHASGEGDSPYRFQYRYNSGSWVTTNGTTYTAPAPRDVGLFSQRIDVRELDALGNASGYRSDTVTQFSVSPAHLSTGQSSKPTLDWPDHSSKFLTSPTYYLYYRNVTDGDQFSKFGIKFVGTNAYKIPTALHLGDQYEWYYTYTYFDNFDFRDPIKTATSPFFRFTVTPFIIKF